MPRTNAPALILLAICAASACGRSRKPIDESSGLRGGAGGVGGVGGVGARTGMAGATTGSQTAGTGVRRPGSAGAAAGGGGAGGVPAGSAGTGTAGFSGGAAGGAGFGGASGGSAAGNGGFGGGGFSGGGFSGGGFSGGGMGGMAGDFEPQTCVWWDGYCGYPDGAQCSSFDCCNLVGDRCCDGSGRCSELIPPPAEWEPPFDASALGAPGWKDSSEPLCPGRGQPQFGSVWSDSRGVFVTSTVFFDEEPSEDETCFGCPAATVHHNDGTGWRRVEGASSTYGEQRMRGFDNGPLVLFGPARMRTNPQQGCGLGVLEGGVLKCQAVDGVTDVAITGSTAYAALQGELVRYDGTSWGPVPVVFPGQRELEMLWANQDLVIATGASAGKLFTLRNNAWTIEDTRTLENFTAVFGLSSTDLWAGTLRDKLHHYDGTGWKEVSWAGAGCASGFTGIHSMWGKDGVLYFATATSLARWNGSSVEVIAQWDCVNASAAITGLWGNSPTEVFVLMSAVNDTRQPCGAQFVYHFDGSKFHRM